MQYRAKFYKRSKERGQAGGMILLADKPCGRPADTGNPRDAVISVAPKDATHYKIYKLNNNGSFHSNHAGMLKINKTYSYGDDIY